MAIVEVNEVLLLRIARELAMEIMQLPDILSKLGISSAQWDSIKELPRFQYLLNDMMLAWQTAQNTPERVKLKSAAMLEEALPEMYQRIHDSREPLAAKTEMLKLVSRLAGIGGETAAGEVKERFVLSINIGDGGTHKIGVDTIKTIEHQP